MTERSRRPDDAEIVYGWVVEVGHFIYSDVIATGVFGEVKAIERHAPNTHPTLRCARLWIGSGDGEVGFPHEVLIDDLDLVIRHIGPGVKT